MRELGFPASDLEQQFRRMVFNIAARNQDDHVKNIAFLMDKTGRWSRCRRHEFVGESRRYGERPARDSDLSRHTVEMGSRYGPCATGSDCSRDGSRFCSYC